MTPKIIAHRGANAVAPENTMAAFQLAMDQCADGIELDVMLSGDGQVVVIHDDTVDRTTNGTGRVREMSLQQLQSLDAGEGEHIPALEEVLAQFGGKCLINIELKNFSSIFDALPHEVAELIIQYELVDSVIVSSFNPFNFRRIRRRLHLARNSLATGPKRLKQDCLPNPVKHNFGCGGCLNMTPFTPISAMWMKRWFQLCMHTTGRSMFGRLMTLKRSPGWQL